MVRTVLSLVVGALATLFVALPMAAYAAADSTSLVPKRLVVDSASAPVLSVDQAPLLVEIVLISDGEYQPVHPDSLDGTDESPPPVPNDTTGDADRP